MRAFSAVFAALLVSSILLAVPARDAHACYCVGVDPSAEAARASLDDADAVVIASLAEFDSSAAVADLQGGVYEGPYTEVTVEEEFKGPHLARLRIGNGVSDCDDFLSDAIGWNDASEPDLGRRFFLSLRRNDVGLYDADQCLSFDLASLDKTNGIEDLYARRLELTRQIAPPLPGSELIGSTVSDDDSPLLSMTNVVTMALLGGTAVASVVAFIVFRRRA